MNGIRQGTESPWHWLLPMSRNRNRNYERALDKHLQRWEQRLPAFAARFVHWLRQPASRWIRFPLGIFLILAGIVGFLPILGFWMVPLGLIVVAQDLPFLQPGLVRLLDWAERKWPAPAPKPK